MNGLKTVGGLYGRHIVLSCSRAGHVHQISYNRKLNPSSLSCVDCKRAEREHQRQIAYEDQQKHIRFMAFRQQELFDEASQYVRQTMNEQQQRFQHQER
jgi:hypothetical protein